MPMPIAVRVVILLELSDLGVWVMYMVVLFWVVYEGRYGEKGCWRKRQNWYNVSPLHMCGQ